MKRGYITKLISKYNVYYLTYATTIDLFKNNDDHITRIIENLDYSLAMKVKKMFVLASGNI